MLLFIALLQVQLLYIVISRIEVQRTNAYKTIPFIVANVIRKLNMAKYSRKFLKPYKELGIELEKPILLCLSFLVLIKEHKGKAATFSI